MHHEFFERADLDAIRTRADLAHAMSAHAYAGPEHAAEVESSALSDTDKRLSYISFVLGLFVPTTDEDAQAAVNLIERLVPEFSERERIYEGPFNMICTTPASFAFQAATAWSYEGADDTATIDAANAAIAARFERLYPQAA